MAVWKSACRLVAVLNVLDRDPFSNARTPTHPTLAHSRELREAWKHTHSFLLREAYDLERKRREVTPICVHSASDELEIGRRALSAVVKREICDDYGARVAKATPK